MGDYRIWVGIGVTLTFAAIRYLYPAIPRPLAWAGLSIGLALIGLAAFPLAWQFTVAVVAAVGVLSFLTAFLAARREAGVTDGEEKPESIWWTRAKSSLPVLLPVLIGLPSGIGLAELTARWGGAPVYVEGVPLDQFYALLATRTDMSARRLIAPYSGRPVFVRGRVADIQSSGDLVTVSLLSRRLGDRSVALWFPIQHEARLFALQRRDQIAARCLFKVETINQFGVILEQCVPVVVEQPS